MSTVQQRRSPAAANNAAAGKENAAAGDSKATNNNQTEEDAAAAAAAEERPLLNADHPHFFKSAAPLHRDQPLTACIVQHTARRGCMRRVAEMVLRLDTRASIVLHRASLFPFDLLLVPFALMCGVYGMPFLIPLVAWLESTKLAATILISTLLTTGCTTLGKRTTRRLRPCPTSLSRKFFNLRRLEHNFSFPSGDSAQGAVVACNLYFYAMAHQLSAIAAAVQSAAATMTGAGGGSDTGAATAAAAAIATVWHPSYFLLLMPLVMSARVYFGAHWWSDTVGGVIIGWGATLAGWALVDVCFGWKFGEQAYDEITGQTSIMRQLGFIQY